MRFTELFTPHRIRDVEIRNRIFSSGHQTILARDGCPTEEMVAYHEARAAGGAGLIIVEAASAHAHSVTTPSFLDASRDECIPGYRSIAEAVHGHGCRVFGQLSHGGRISHGHEGLLSVPYAPSSVPDHRFHAMPRAMSTALVWEVIAAYASAARRLVEAGLDGVEMMASHGLLLAQFLSPDVNRREDEFGGTPEKRFRFVREVVDAVREAVGPGRVVGIRISADEDDPTGLDQEQVLEICGRMDALDGLDYLSVTLGSMAGLGSSVHVVPPMAYEHGYTVPYAARIREVFSRSLFVVGRINQPQTAEKVLADGHADMCGMTRAMIADPEMPAKALAGRLDDIRACIGCNQACIGHYHSGVPISCIQHPPTGRERTLGAHPGARTKRAILVAGGGPAGMKAAAIAAERGHQVVLCESGARLGGQVLLAQALPGREEFGVVVENLRREMENAGVEIRLKTPVDAALVAHERPDAVIVATGALPAEPDAEIADGTHVVDAWQLIRGTAEPGASVVIADWRCDWIGVGLAERLARDGHRVRLAVDGTHAGQELQIYVRETAARRLHDLGVEVIPYARLHGADGDTAYFHHTALGEPILCEGMDTLVLALGHRPLTTLEEALATLGVEIHPVGDCLSPRTAEEAIYEGFLAGRAI